MKKEYESPIFEFRRIIFSEDILTISDPYPTIDTTPEVSASGGSDNFDESDPFGW